MADFHEDNFEKEAWFTKDGVWQMTETDLRYADLPAPVSYTHLDVYKRQVIWYVERKNCRIMIVYLVLLFFCIPV